MNFTMRQIIQLIIAALFASLISQAHSADFKNMEQDFNDSVITTIITTKFTRNKSLNPLKISVSTEEGVVKLSGHVKNKRAFVRALRIAKSTRGVKSVNTEDLEIKVVNTVFTDAYITAKIEAAILKAKVLDDESIPLVGINASTENGIVTLSGTLKSDKAVAAILKRASAVKGVKKVISKLQTLNQPT